jgi:hypothetical protein
MSESNRRTIRTVAQIVAALIVAIPVIILALPSDVQAAPVVVAVGVWVGVVTKAWTALEDAGVIPAFLRNTNDPA